MFTLSLSFKTYSIVEILLTKRKEDMKKLMKGLVIGNWKITEDKVVYIKNVKPKQEIHLEELSSKLITLNGVVYDWPVFIGGMTWCYFEDAINLLKVVSFSVDNYDLEIELNTFNEIVWVFQDKLAS